MNMEQAVAEASRRALSDEFFDEMDAELDREYDEDCGEDDEHFENEG